MDDERERARRLRNSILHQLGLGSPLLLSLACTPTSPSEGDEGGVTTNPSGGVTSVDGEVSSDDADDNWEVDGEVEGDEPKLDVSVKYDVPAPPPKDCWDDWSFSIEQLPPEFASCDFSEVDPEIYPAYLMICVALPDGGTCEDICSDSLCEGMEECLNEPIHAICGPIEIGADCCVVIATEQPPPVGRPFVIAGRPRLAAAPELQDSLAAHWLEVARGEHASIAAFARFTATLLRFAAPAPLVADTLAAARDEARHTRDALALASRFAGRPLALGELAITDALRDSDDLARAVVDAVREGCIAETLAAHEAACLAARAEDPQVAAVLGRIADDEARHAALAWRFVAWVLQARPQLRGVIERAFATHLQEPSVAPRSTDTPELLAFGCPSVDRRARWHELGLRELVSPCAAALLATTRRTAPARSPGPASSTAPGPRR